MATNDGACIICHNASPPPIQSGCACRGDGGLAHIGCLVEAAVSQQAHRGDEVWRQCQTCKQEFTGAMRTGLAEAWRLRVAGQAAESDERRAAEGNLAQSLLAQGNDVEAERMLRRLHEFEMRLLGAEHPDTLATAADLATSLMSQEKYSDAERLQREMIRALKSVLGAEHPNTLANANNLAGCLNQQGKYAEAEQIQRELLEVRKRLLGAEHPHTLASASGVAKSLSGQGKYADAEQIQREVHGVCTRVLGTEHPHTLTSASNLALSISHRGQLTEAEQMLQATLASCQRVLGPAHYATLLAARNLEDVRTRIRAAPPTTAAAPASPMGAPRLLPAESAHAAGCRHLSHPFKLTGKPCPEPFGITSGRRPA